MEEELQAGSDSAVSVQPQNNCHDADNGERQADDQAARAPAEVQKKSKKTKKPWSEGYKIKRLSKDTSQDKVVQSDAGDGPDKDLDGHTRAPSPSTCSPSSSSSNSDKSEPDSEDSSSDSDSDEEGEAVQPPPKKPRLKASTSTYVRFNPGVGDKPTFTLPTADMVEYASHLFTTYVTDKQLKDTILSEYPVPSGVPGMKVPKMDDYISELFSAKKQDFGRTVDDNWSKMQSRVLDTMGPLGKLWAVMDTVRLDETGEDEIDLYECLELVEKDITLVGQAFVTGNYFRRQNVLFRFTKDPKKTKALLKQHDELLDKTHGMLFGKSFYKRLSKSAKIRKQTKEISNQLGESKPKKAYSGGQKQQNSGKAQESSQPFRAGPSSNRGGGRKVNFSRRGKGNNRGKYLVSVCLNKRKGNSSSDRCLSKHRQSKRVKISRGKRVRNSDLQSNRLDTSGGTPRDRSPTFCKRKVIRKGGGEVKRMCSQLAITDTGSVNNTDCQWVKNPICVRAPPREGATAISPVKQGFTTDLRRDREHEGQRGGNGGDSMQGAVCQSPLSGTQERRVPTPCDQLEKVECSRGLLTLQNGGTTPPKGVDPTIRLHDESRPEGCLLQCPSSSGTQTSLEVQVGGEALPVRVHAIRTGACPTVVHQATEARGGSPSSSGSTHYCVPGRYDYTQSEQGGSSQGQELASLLANAIRVCDKLEEVPFDSDPDLGFLGVFDRYHQDDHVSSTRQGLQDNRQVSKDDCRQISHSQDTCRDGGFINLISKGYSTSTSVLQTDANGPDESFASGSILRGQAYVASGGSQRASVVDPECTSLEWPCHNYSLPGSVNRDRRFFEWLGGSPRYSEDWGSMDSRGEGSPYQRSRVEGGLVCNKILCNQTAECTYPSEDGQYICSGLYSENGRDQVLPITESGSGTLGVLFTEEHPPISRASSRSPQCRGRLGIEEYLGSQRLETEPLNLQTDSGTLGTFPDRPVCQQAQYPVNTICELEARPLCGGYRCFSDELGREEGISIPSFFHDSQESVKSVQRQSYSCHNNSNVAVPVVVPHVTGDVSGLSNPPSSHEGLTDLPQGGPPPAVRQSDLSGLASVRRQALARGVSAEAAELLAKHSWRKSTSSVYESAWGQWCSWCNKHQIDPFHSPVEDIVNYLTMRFNKGDKYNTLNTRDQLFLLSIPQWGM